MIDFFSGFFEALQQIGQFALFTVKGEVVRVSQLVLALVLLIIGLLFSRWLAIRLRKVLISRTKADQSSALLLQQIFFYVLVVAVILSTLQMLQIPITLFAFLGGAIVIGVGFGAQNIFNNFMSGIILMVERPIRIGDLIEVDSHHGYVKTIGARCTHIRLVDGIEMLVPNSVLLESNVTNRTLSDKKVRTTVSVGVQYGSPTEEVAAIMQRVAEEHPLILSDPQPVTLFQEFGDSALNFEVYFWVEIDLMITLRKVRSDVRFAIDREFRKNGITIAFPQLDAHLDASQPLEVHLKSVE
ncbi:MAG: mechanosensitive ion channel [Candidatus Delongbacteria bacterium]|nr:mechanosensitive ion channel [Candidatus Delongbacteria bacterium]